MRYTRDEIIVQGIELAIVPQLVTHDIPGGLVDPNAFAIKWLQNALDTFHRKFPFSSDVFPVDMTIRANNTDLVLTSDITKYLPTDFMLDVRNGVLASLGTRQYRLKRESFQYWLSYQLATQGSPVTQPTCYTIIQNRIKVLPLVTANMPATLWYYAVPAPLQALDKPNFPDEWSLIEFIRLKCLEFVRFIDLGTAHTYLHSEIARLKANGLINDTEYDTIPLENNQTVYRRGYAGWMGSTAPNL